MADSQGLFDALAGAAGHPINRPALDNFVAQSQARNGLVSAQTDEAIGKARAAQEEQAAKGQLQQSLRTMMGPNNQSQADAAANVMLAGFSDAKGAITALNEWQQNQQRATLGDPNQLGSPAQTAAQQGLQGKIAEPIAVPKEYATLPGAYKPDVQQTPLGQADTAAMSANAGLHQAQADAGGFNPHTGANTGNPEQDAALNKAVIEGRLDPAKLNSRTAPIFARMEMATPGTNYNRLTADAALQRNSGFQQKAMVFEALPTIMTHMTELGKKVGYSDYSTIGKMQQFMNGQLNDPDYTEYMAVRNDALMNIASVMRGTGMSDQAHKAEMEAASPTLSPLALDGWLKGQMATLKPRLQQVQRVEHHGDRPDTPVGQNDTGQGDTATPQAAATAPQNIAKPMTLDEYLKSRGH
jgi:hypothetical protein